MTAAANKAYRDRKKRGILFTRVCRICGKIFRASGNQRCCCLEHASFWKRRRAVTATARWRLLNPERYRQFTINAAPQRSRQRAKMRDAIEVLRAEFPELARDLGL